MVKSYHSGMDTENPHEPNTSNAPVLIFDLDGTLIDSVYQHVLAWREAFEMLGLHVAAWEIHRRIGQSDRLLSKQLSSEAGKPFNAGQMQEAVKLHTQNYLKREHELRLLPGACELLALLAENSMKYGIATSSSVERASGSIKMLGVRPEVPVITIENVSYGKPDPDLFLAAISRLETNPGNCIIIGDSPWDILAARRAGSLAVGVLTGGFSSDELFRAGAFRVYKDPADIQLNLDELGVHIPA